MNCDECQEQVFELIEREAVDPEGVREILARCPDCRAAFDEMKAALAVVEELPIEEPPAAVDAAILRAAAARAPKVVPLRRRRLQPPPWAMAAIAMLAIGVGVWAIPRQAPLEGEPGPTEMTDADEAIIAEPMLEQEAEVEEVIAQAEATPQPTAGDERAERAAAKRKAASPELATVKRRSSRSANESKAAVVAEAPAAQPAADMAAGAAAESWSAEADSTASRARKQERDDDAACKRKIGQIERRKRDDKDYVAEPEEKLAIGKCYQKLDNVTEARKWLQRAALHPETKARAEEALRQLGPE